jgi:hypothetical protein
VNPEQEPNRNDSECPQDWRASKVSPSDILGRAAAWLKEQAALFEAFWVAVSFHVLLFPLIWFAGWALPWPKSPNITTVIELNLENWPNDARPMSIEELYDTEMSKARSK